MSPKDIEKTAQQEWKFARSLNEARRRIDPTSPVGKALDKILYPLYKKYGFYDSSRLMTDADFSNVSDKDVAFFNQKEQKIMSDLGIDVDYYNNLTNLPHNVSSDLATAYVRATGALRDVRRKLVSEKHSSGNMAWDIYGILHWVVDFSNMLNKIKHERHESIKHKKAEIVEHLQKLIYHTPKKLDTNIDTTAKDFEIDRYYVIESFKEIIGQTPKEYVELLMNEALGDYVKFHGRQLANKVIGKVAGGQTKTIAQAKVKAGQDMNTLLTKWNQTVLGNPKAATPAALRAFLLNTVKADPAVITAVMKKYRTKLMKESKSLKEDYLPQGQLRNFFLDLINTQRAAALKTPRKQVATNVAPSPAKAIPLPNTPFVQPAGATKGVAAQPMSQPMAQPIVHQKPAAKPAPAVGDVEATLQTLPTNLRAQAILQALPTLSDEQIKQILNGLITKK